MISFRFFIVAVVAVFLALALGIVVGTTALNGPITTDLRSQVKTLNADRTTLADQNKTLQGQLSDANQFASHYGSELVANALTSQKVLLLGLPGASSYVEDGVAAQIADAGGSVTGRVQLTPQYVDPAQSSDIISLATGSLRPIDIQLTPTIDAGVLGGELLSFVLVGKGLPTDLTQVIGGFAALHMLTASGSITPATDAVVVGTGSTSAAAATMEFDLVSALSHDGAHVVVAGDSASATSGGVVALVRAKADASVSAVDNADTAMGDVATVFALADAIRSQVGQYGTGAGAQTLFP